MGGLSGDLPGRFLLNKVVWVHKNTPDAAKQELRAAFASMLNDPEFIAQKARALGPYPVDPRRRI